MPVRKDKDGRRSVEAEVEVPGTPEEVWQAIATGQGISSWFVPSTVEGHVGGTTVTSFGPGMDAVAQVTEWHPPTSYTAEAAAEPGPEAPGTVATEWIVEPRAGGTCVVRVVHRWFADTDDWDGQFEGHAYGWATSFFRFLRLYLSHFRGQQCSAFQLAAFSERPALETWRIIRGALNITQPSGPFTAIPEAPVLGGEVERGEVTDPELLRIRESSPQIVAALAGMQGEEPELFLRLDRPAPGLAHIFTMAMGDQTMVSMRCHFFGDDVAAVAAEAERAWQGWLAGRFPPPASARGPDD